MKRIISFFVALLMLFSVWNVSAINFEAKNSYEAENLKMAKVQGEAQIIEDASFSGGKAYKLIASKGEDFIINDYIRFNAPIYQRGLYNIKARVRKGPDCGIIQLWFSDTNWRSNAKIDMYSKTEEVVEVDFGNSYCDLGEERWFEFRVDGKNADSSGYNFVIDTMTITFVDVYEAEGAILADYRNDAPAAESSTGYEWGQVMEGGTGCSTHLVFHPKEEGLMYMGTDMGGAYRWDNKEYTWTPITDSFSMEESQYWSTGVDGLAVDPQNPDILYAALGINANKGEKYMGHIYKSYNRGESWEDTGFKGLFCANGTFRYATECIAVDPANSNVVLCATMDGRIIKSTDGFKTWKEIPVPFTTNVNGVCPRNIVFDKTTAAANGCLRIYLGTTGAGMWVSENGGESFNRINSCPIPENYEIYTLNISNDGTLLAGTQTELFKFKNGEWSDISPVKGKKFWTSQIYPTDSDFIVTTMHWGPVGQYGEYVYVTTDGGKTWKLINDTLIRNNYIPRIEYNSFFANTTQIAMDPFNKGRVGFVGWQNFYLTENILEEKVKITNYTRGVEHGCIRNMTAFPTGARLIVSAYDYKGGRITDVTQFISNMLPPKNSGANNTAFCEDNPNFVVRMGNNYGWYSTDNGINWRPMESLPVMGQHIMSLDVSKNVHPETGNPVIYTLFGGNTFASSKDLGKTWITADVPKYADTSKWSTPEYIASDRKDNNIVYYAAEGNLYKSEDFGESFKLITEFGTIKRIKSMFGRRNYLFVLNNEGRLFYSSSQGDLFKEISGDFEQVLNFAFGKEEKEGDPATLYVTATKKDGTYVICRSQDIGKTWKEIYNDKTATVSKMIVMGDIEGDRQMFGLVYLGSSGRGVHYGLPAGNNIFYKIRENDIQVLINGQTVMFDVEPQLINDRTMVPMRKIFEDVGAKVEWDEATQTVTATRTVSDAWKIETTEVQLTIGNNKIKINGVEKEMDVAPIVINDRTLVPVRFISEALGAKVDWIDEKQLVKITP